MSYPSFRATPLMRLSAFSRSEASASSGRWCSLLLMAGLLCTQGVMAQTGKSGAASAPVAASGASAGKLAHADASFLKDASEGGATELEASKIALQKSSNTQVKSFAQQMVDDHTKVGQEVSSLAASKGVDVKTEPSVADKAKLKVLSMRDGASFDQHYAKSAVSAHQDTIKLFQKEIKDGKDDDVKAFATKTLPTLQHHLELAQNLRNQTDKESK